jgi:hypothetical protein
MNKFEFKSYIKGRIDAIYSQEMALQNTIQQAEHQKWCLNNKRKSFEKMLKEKEVASC